MKLKEMTRIALCTALTAVFAQIIIPLPFTPVPITCAIIAVMLCGGLLSPRSAFLSQLVYLLLGLAGAPVFSGFGGGPAKLLGPTGGYLIAYPLMALLIALILNKTGRRSIPLTTAAMLAGLVVCYALGTVWLAASTGRTLTEALLAGAVPFAGFDAAKAVFCALLVKALEKPLLRIAQA